VLGKKKAVEKCRSRSKGRRATGAPGNYAKAEGDNNLLIDKRGKVASWGPFRCGRKFFGGGKTGDIQREKDLYDSTTTSFDEGNCFNLRENLLSGKINGKGKKCK